MAHATITTPEQALEELKQGNKRFIAQQMINTDYMAQIQATKDDQHPFGAVLSCLDSRIPPEIIFDQGIGNIFVARNAGNIEDENMLGSLEFATHVKDVKIILVMGHNHCGAIKGAVGDVELGHLTQLVSQIKTAIPQEGVEDEHIHDATAIQNVKDTMRDITERSPVIRKLVDENKVGIYGAFYDIETGIVEFLEG
jgi:carbonic anhydrase